MEDIKIVGLANKKELAAKEASHRLYKFELNRGPPNLWVLLLQRAGLGAGEVTVSANADQTELWASADGNVSPALVLEEARRAVAQANLDFNETEEKYNRAEKERVAAQASFVAELDSLSFDAPATVTPSAPAPRSPGTDEDFVDLFPGATKT